MKDEKVSVPEKDSSKEDELDQQRAESEGMIQHDWADEELAEILAEDLLNGGTPG